MLFPYVDLLLALTPMSHYNACVMPKTVPKDLLENSYRLKRAILLASGLAIKYEGEQLDEAGVLLDSAHDALHMHEVVFGCHI